MPRTYGERRRQPVAGLGAGAAAVERLDQRLAVLVVPEADAGCLAPAPRRPGGRPLAEVVVQGVHAGCQVDGELVARDGPAAGADGVDPLRVAGRLGLGDRVRAGAEVQEDISAVAVGRLARWTELPMSSVPSRVIVTPGMPCSPKSTWPSSLKSAKTTPERLAGGSGVASAHAENSEVLLALGPVSTVAVAEISSPTAEAARLVTLNEASPGDSW